MVTRSDMDLTGRVARCHCGNTAPSSPDLFCFTFRGEGSETATKVCKCGYFESAHEREDTRVSSEPVACPFGGFTPQGPFPDDGYYCGCDGWD